MTNANLAMNVVDSELPSLEIMATFNITDNFQMFDFQTYCAKTYYDPGIGKDCH
jgi:hypothetical protein